MFSACLKFSNILDVNATKNITLKLFLVIYQPRSQAFLISLPPARCEGKTPWERSLVIYLRLQSKSSNIFKIKLLTDRKEFQVCSSNKIFT